MLTLSPEQIIAKRTEITWDLVATLGRADDIEFVQFIKSLDLAAELRQQAKEHTGAYL